MGADEERSIVVGLVMGLGYLGLWEPMLEKLGPGEPWLHEAAVNVFEYWVPTPLGSGSAEAQRLEAARWIGRRLRAELAPEVRLTLEQIKEGLEIKLGWHVPPEEA